MIGNFAYPNSAGIYLGMREENLDEIWRVAWDWDGEGDEKAKVSNNIFEFIKNFEGEIIDKEIKDKLYKNWGDEYWRVREE